MVRPKQTDRNAIRADFYNYNGSLKQFCKDRGLEYAGISVWLKARDRERFHKQVMQTAQSQMVTRASGDIVERLEKHWELTNIIEAKILQKLQEDAAEPKSLEQLLRVLQENVRLTNSILQEFFLCQLLYLVTIQIHVTIYLILYSQLQLLKVYSKDEHN